MMEKIFVNPYAQQLSYEAYAPCDWTECQCDAGPCDDVNGCNSISWS